MRTDFDKYILVLCCFGPVCTVLMNLTYYLPVIGMPYLSSGLIVAVNVLNIVLDVVFIKGFSMGCEGAALATFVSYLVVLIISLFVCKVRKAPLTLRKPPHITEYMIAIAKKGLPSGSVQAGYAVTTAFCNHFMNLAFGIEGVVAMSLFAQMDSVISIVLTGVVDNNASFAAMLKGEGDYYGIRSLTKHVAITIVSVCFVISLCFALFSRNVSALFNIIDDKSLSLIAALTPIYVMYYPLRSLLLLLRDIYSTFDRSVYATSLGIIDKTISIPLVGGVLYLIFGGYGLVLAFPVSMTLILITIVIVNLIIVKKSKGRYSPVLLLDEQDPLKNLCSFTVDSNNNPAQAGQDIEKCREEYKIDPSVTKRICLAVEEIYTYIQKRSPSRTPTDILISCNENNFIVICRNAGQSFCPFDTKNIASNENELLLSKLFHIKHEHIFGLNSINLTIGVRNHE